MTKVMLILSIPSGLEFQAVSHYSIYGNSDSNAFKI